MLNTISKSIPKPIQFQNLEGDLINSELGRFLNSKIIEPVCQGARDRDEYVSNLFIRPKKDGKVRVILNLIQFNLDCMEHIHFKMKTLKSAVESMRQNCYFVSIDLSEAFYSIPVRVEDRKYFRFWYESTKYQFTALVMGLSTSPRVFTKIMKPVFATLRAQGYIVQVTSMTRVYRGKLGEDVGKMYWQLFHSWIHWG